MHNDNIHCRQFILLYILIYLIGCNSVSKKSNNIDNIPKDIKNKEEMQTAVDSIANTMRQKGVRTKYCPICGRHYNAKLDTCPKDGAKLLYVEE